MPCLSQIFSLDPPPCDAKMGGIRALLWSTDAIKPSIEITPGSDFIFNVTGNFQRIPGRGSFQCVAQVNEAEGGVYYRSEFAFNPDGYASGADAVAYLLAAFSEMGDEDITVLAEDWNGKFHVMGWGLASINGTVGRMPLFLSAAQDGTGTEHTDRTGFALTLASTHPLPAPLAYDYFTIINPSND